MQEFSYGDAIIDEEKGIGVVVDERRYNKELVESIRDLDIFQCSAKNGQPVFVRFGNNPTPEWVDGTQLTLAKFNWEF